METESFANYGDENVIHDYEAHINPSLAALMKFVGYDSVEIEARGCLIKDSRGREFLDCLGGYGTMSVGYSASQSHRAVREQLERQAFSCRVLFNATQTRLGQKTGRNRARRFAMCFLLQQRRRSRRSRHQTRTH